MWALLDAEVVHQHPHGPRLHVMHRLVEDDWAGPAVVHQVHRDAAEVLREEGQVLAVVRSRLSKPGPSDGPEFRKITGSPSPASW